MATLPSMWVILDGLPLFVCRMHSTQLQPTVLMSVKVTAELQWSACTCMCVMISLTWHHTSISNIILI